MHERICIYKTTGKRPALDDVVEPSKRYCNNVCHIGGALDGALAYFRMDLEKENQNDIIWGLKESMMDMEHETIKILKRSRGSSVNYL